MTEKLIIFTDLDGTLLDHDSYSFDAALPALKELQRREIPIIINSSKTAAEITELRLQFDNCHPFIVENGSAVCVPQDYFSGGCTTPATDYSIHYFGPDYESLRSTLDNLRSQQNLTFRGFAEMSNQELAELTGLSPADAAKAKQRHSSEPLLWMDSEAALAGLSKQLESLGLVTVRGGRFVHVMGNTDKANAMKWLMQRYIGSDLNTRWTTVALGDSPNDRQMLEAADIAVVIPAANGVRLKLTNNRVLRPAEPGPAGWCTAIMEILKNY